MTDECKFEIKEDRFSAKMPLISKQEYKQLNSNIEGFARAITKLVIVDKNMAIAQHIIRKQQEKIEQLEAGRTEVISYMQRMIVMTKEAIKNLADTKYYYERQEMKAKLEVYEEILKLMKGE